MSLHAIRVISFGAILCFASLLIAQTPAVAGKDRVEQLNPFTHVAYIAAQTNPKSIRFEKIRYVHVPTKIAYTYHTPYCESAASREPGGSSFCPAAKEEVLVPAYELTYSFQAPARPSNTRNWQSPETFHVYFQPDELTPELRNAVDANKVDRADVAAHFAVNVSHEMANQTVVDTAESTFCDTKLMDGLWVQSDRNCTAKIAHTTVLSPSSHLKITIVPSSASSPDGQVVGTPTQSSTSSKNL
jgi:hypothetical protein